MKIILVRHGKTTQNKDLKIQGLDDNLLDPKYYNELDIAIDELKKYNLNIEKLYTSPLKRAYDTILYYSKGLGINKNVFFNENLIERDFGTYTSKSVKILPLKNPNFTFEKNENLENRSFNALKEIYEANKNLKTILITSHSHFIKSILTQTNSELYDYSFKFYNGAFIILDFDGNNIKIENIFINIQAKY